MSLLDTSGADDELDAVEPMPDDPSGGAHTRDAGPPPPDRTRLRLALDVAVVAASALFVFWQLHPDLLLARTTPAGGDMGAHVWALGYLRDHLLPELRLSGWTPDWYAGFPVFQYYMVVPFLAMVVLNTGLAGAAGVLPAAVSLAVSARAAGASWRDRTVAGVIGAAAVVALVGGAIFGFGPSFRLVLLVVSVGAAVTAMVWGRGTWRRALGALAIAVALLGVAMPFGPSFKLVSVAGVVAMPVAAYLFGRLSRLPHPTPALLSVMTVAYLFDKSFTIYGGNIASTMAGEFAFSISLALAIVYLGVLMRGLRDGGHRTTAAVLLALVGLCHLLPAFFAILATAVILVVHLAAEPAATGTERRRTDLLAAAAATAVVAGAVVAAVADLFTVGPIVAVAGTLLVCLAILWATRVGTGDVGEDEADELDDADAPGGPAPTEARRLWWPRTWWLASTGVVAALLAAWWVLPFYWQRTFLNDMGWEKIAVHHEGTALWSWFTDDVWSVLVTQDLRAFAALALVGAVLSLVFRSRAGVSLVLIGLMLALAFVFVPQGRLWNARLLPFWYLVVYFLAAVGVAEIVRALAQVVSPRPDRPRSVLTMLAAPVALLVVGAFFGGQLRNLPGGGTNPDGSYRLLKSVGIPGLFSVDVPDALAIDVQGRNFVTDWSRWNYSGYERKTAYPEYRGIVTTMEAVGREYGCGRSLWEYSPDLNDYGTPMALMLLPHWTDGCIGSMEGLYFEASSTTPFHFLMQSELSKSPSRAQRDMPYRDLDVDAGVQHLQLMGVRYYLARSPEATKAAEANPDLTRVAADGPWTVFEVADAPLVEPLRYEPAVTTAGGAQHQWLCSGEDESGRCTGPALDWFQDPSRWPVELAVDGPDNWQRIDPGQAPERRPVEPAVVDDVRVDDDRISFHVDRPGTPVLVKMSYFPNWQASGADGPYRVAPNLMVVVPTSNDVVLHYGRQPVDLAAIALTLLGIAAAVVLARRPRLAVRRLRDAEGTLDEPV